MCDRKKQSFLQIFSNFYSVSMFYNKLKFCVQIFIGTRYSIAFCQSLFSLHFSFEKHFLVFKINSTKFNNLQKIHINKHSMIPNLFLDAEHWRIPHFCRHETDSYRTCTVTVFFWVRSTYYNRKNTFLVPLLPLCNSPLNTTSTNDSRSTMFRQKI